jgi:hypothetical protein
LSVATAAMLATPILQESAHAQARRGNRATTAPRRAVRVAPAPRRGRVVVGAYYRPLYFSSFYNPYYDPFYYPSYYASYYPSFPYGYGGYSPYAYSQFSYPESALRLQVSPRETEVFVDGYYAGVVDDFDGAFQRLRLESGEHDVTLYLAGYSTRTEKILLQPGSTFNVRHSMVLLPAGAAHDPRPSAVARPEAPRQAPSPAVQSGPEARDALAVRGDASFGAIAVRVQPADADVLVDGERWEGPADDEALVLQIAPGMHRVEVRKDGYRSYAGQVDVHAGETAPINISLPRQ